MNSKNNDMGTISNCSIKNESNLHFNLGNLKHRDLSLNKSFFTEAKELAKISHGKKIIKDDVLYKTIRQNDKSLEDEKNSVPHYFENHNSDKRIICRKKSVLLEKEAQKDLVKGIMSKVKSDKNLNKINYNDSSFKKKIDAILGSEQHQKMPKRIKRTHEKIEYVKNNTDSDVAKKICQVSTKCKNPPSSSDSNNLDFEGSKNMDSNTKKAFVKTVKNCLLEMFSKIESEDEFMETDPCDKNVFNNDSTYIAKPSPEDKIFNHSSIGNVFPKSMLKETNTISNNNNRICNEKSLETIEDPVILKDSDSLGNHNQSIIVSFPDPTEINAYHHTLQDRSDMRRFKDNNMHLQMGYLPRKCCTKANGNVLTVKKKYFAKFSDSCLKRVDNSCPEPEHSDILSNISETVVVTIDFINKIIQIACKLCIQEISNAFPLLLPYATEYSDIDISSSNDKLLQLPKDCPICSYKKFVDDLRVDKLIILKGGYYSILLDFKIYFCTNFLPKLHETPVSIKVEACDNLLTPPEQSTSIQSNLKEIAKQFNSNVHVPSLSSLSECEKKDMIEVFPNKCQKCQRVLPFFEVPLIEKKMDVKYTYLNMTCKYCNLVISAKNGKYSFIIDPYLQEEYKRHLSSINYNDAFVKSVWSQFPFEFQSLLNNCYLTREPLSEMSSKEKNPQHIEFISDSSKPVDVYQIENRLVCAGCFQNLKKDEVFYHLSKCNTSRILNSINVSCLE
ncbi:hypothetical protein CDAR_5111 [Caerostris darwini]|uniref:Uncharacterized protein n=1 Tax=Caerostris darwini TaxID=1538125 RepID=A0AAV4P422_9ARAC|nr:hypothetical protein CDAR_5111 [Caerostris darwini]